MNDRLCVVMPVYNELLKAAAKSLWQTAAFAILQQRA